VACDLYFRWVRAYLDGRHTINRARCTRCGEPLKQVTSGVYSRLPEDKRVGEPAFDMGAPARKWRHG
jgi:hypothetical protein